MVYHLPNQPTLKITALGMSASPQVMAGPMLVAGRELTILNVKTWALGIEATLLMLNSEMSINKQGVQMFLFSLILTSKISNEKAST